LVELQEFGWSWVDDDDDDDDDFGSGIFGEVEVEEEFPRGKLIELFVEREGVYMHWSRLCFSEFESLVY
jgi:hypothetical protein